MEDPLKLGDLNNDNKVYSALAGVMHAVQALATVVLDDEVKRSKVAKLLESLSEAALHSELTQDRKQEYLAGLSSLGIASESSKDWHQPDG